MIDLNQKLAARFEHLQIERILRSEVIADLLGNEVDRVVDEVLQIVQRKRDSATRSADISDALKKIPGEADRDLREIDVPPGTLVLRGSGESPCKDPASGLLPEDSTLCGPGRRRSESG